MICRRSSPCSRARTSTSPCSSSITGDPSSPTFNKIELTHGLGRGLETEGPELRPLAQAALELGEARERDQADHVVPQPDRVVRLEQAADDRAEERHAVRRLELDDRGPAVLA